MLCNIFFTCCFEAFIALFPSGNSYSSCQSASIAIKNFSCSVVLLFCCCCCFLLSFLAVLHVVLPVLKLACTTVVACLSRISWFIARHLKIVGLINEFVSY